MGLFFRRSLYSLLKFSAHNSPNSGSIYYFADLLPDEFPPGANQYAKPYPSLKRVLEICKKDVFT